MPINENFNSGISDLAIDRGTSTLRPYTFAQAIETQWQCLSAARFGSLDHTAGTTASGANGIGMESESLRPGGLFLSL